MLKLGMGSLHWTEKETLDTTIYSLLLAWEGFVETQRMLHGVADQEKPAEKPKQSPKEVAAILRSFKGRKDG